MKTSQERKQDIARDIKEEVVSYWDARSKDFASLRKRELSGSKADRWKKEILPFIPEKRRDTKILDVGTGSGFFSLLLAEEGYENVTGIDLTPAMIDEAKLFSTGLKNRPSFFVMDAEALDFPDQSFDVVLTRNLTWTLPHPDQAYREWYRVLRAGGLLLNFDADYGKDEDSHSELPESHAHRGISPELMHRHDQIMAVLPNSYLKRPGVDVEFLKAAGFTEVTVDFMLSDRIYQEMDEFYNPTRMFALRARKEE